MKSIYTSKENLADTLFDISHGFFDEALDENESEDAIFKVVENEEGELELEVVEKK